MKTLLITLSICLTTATAMCESFSDADTGLTFPESIAGWTRVSVKKYPERELGVSVGYQKPNGHTITLYVYSKGYSSIPSGADSEIMRSEILEVGEGIKTIWQQDGGKATLLANVSELRDDQAKGVFALTSAYKIEMPSEKLISISAVTGFKNRILKLRYTYSGTDLAEGLQAAGAFAISLAKVNAKAMDPFFREVLSINEKIPQKPQASPSPQPASP